MDDLVGGGHGDDEAPRHGALPHQEDSISVGVGGQDLVGSVPGEVDVEPGLRSVNCGLSLCQTICHWSCHSPPDQHFKSDSTYKFNNFHGLSLAMENLKLI